MVLRNVVSRPLKGSDSKLYEDDILKLIPNESVGFIIGQVSGINFDLTIYFIITNN